MERTGRIFYVEISRSRVSGNNTVFYSTLVQRVQLGLQQGYRYSLWQLCGSIAGFTGVLAGIWFHASLPALVLAIAGAPIFATTL
jgi:hypothetical protein